jgi:hemerythrin-like domain-containing protein
MKRAEQLQKLSREHHTSLSMANNIAKIAKQGNENEFADAIKRIKEYNEKELEPHFRHEEQTLFSVIFEKYPKHIELATTLLKEHGFIRRLVPVLTPETARKDLADFALVLKNHTRLEERELFPIVESLFTDEELEAVLNYVEAD